MLKYFHISFSMRNKIQNGASFCAKKATFDFWTRLKCIEWLQYYTISLYNYIYVQKMIGFFINNTKPYRYRYKYKNHAFQFSFRKIGRSKVTSNIHTLRYVILNGLFFAVAWPANYTRGTETGQKISPFQINNECK